MIAADVHALEDRAMNAWPALQSVAVGGWIFRFAGGCTKRANSINAIATSARFEEVRQEAEALYASRGLPAIFRISPLAPSGCDAALEADGYRYFDPSLVMVAPIESQNRQADVEIESQPCREWLEGISRANGIAAERRPAHDAIVRSIFMPAAFATLRQDGLPAGFGLAVRERGMVGRFNIVVSPAARGRGCGRAITQALMAWGQAGGAKSSYLQVRSENAIAMSLYESLGFVEAYRYHYRLPPE